MQQIVWAKDGVVRFRQNAIVRFLLDAGPHNMNTLACMNFSKDDEEQFAQLIGYSVSGFGDLSYASRKTVAAADEIAENLPPKRQRRR
jgi:hypothetical protein